MELYNYFKDCIKRVFLYQFLIFFSILKFSDTYQYSDDFHKNLRFFFKQLHLSPKILQNQVDKKETIYIIFLIGFFSKLSLFNSSEKQLAIIAKPIQMQIIKLIEGRLFSKLSFDIFSFKFKK